MQFILFLIEGLGQQNGGKVFYVLLSLEQGYYSTLFIRKLLARGQMGCYHPLLARGQMGCYRPLLARGQMGCYRPLLFKTAH